MLAEGPLLPALDRALRGDPDHEVEAPPVTNATFPAISFIDELLRGPDHYPEGVVASTGKARSLT